MSKSITSLDYDPLADINLSSAQKKARSKGHRRKKKTPQQLRTRTATGRIPHDDYAALKKWTETHKTTINEIIGVMVHKLLTDEEWRRQTAIALIEQREAEEAERVAALLQRNEGIRAKVEEILENETEG